MTDREIRDALHNIRSLCLPGQNWSDDIARLTLAEFDRAAIEINGVIKARDTLLDACRTEREELAVDQAGSHSPDIQKHLGDRIAWLDSVIALAHRGKPTAPRSTS
jgi:hypothetical protein